MDNDIPTPQEAALHKDATVEACQAVLRDQLSRIIPTERSARSYFSINDSFTTDFRIAIDRLVEQVEVAGIDASSEKLGDAVKHVRSTLADRRQKYESAGEKKLEEKEVDAVANGIAEQIIIALKQELENKKELPFPLEDGNKLELVMNDEDWKTLGQSLHSYVLDHIEVILAALDMGSSIQNILSNSKTDLHETVIAWRQNNLHRYREHLEYNAAVSREDRFLALWRRIQGKIPQYQGIRVQMAKTSQMSAWMDESIDHMKISHDLQIKATRLANESTWIEGRNTARGEVLEAIDQTTRVLDTAFPTAQDDGKQKLFSARETLNLLGRKPEDVRYILDIEHVRVLLETPLEGFVHSEFYSKYPYNWGSERNSNEIVMAVVSLIQSKVDGLMEEDDPDERKKIAQELLTAIDRWLSLLDAEKKLLHRQSETGLARGQERLDSKALQDANVTVDMVLQVLARENSQLATIRANPKDRYMDADAFLELQKRAYESGKPGRARFESALDSELARFIANYILKMEPQFTDPNLNKKIDEAVRGNERFTNGNTVHSQMLQALNRDKVYYVLEYAERLGKLCDKRIGEGVQAREIVSRI